MQKTPLKRLSFLGLLLLVVSAFTAKILPITSTNNKFNGSEDNGTLRSESGYGGGNYPLSCVTDEDEAYSCHLSGSQFTTTTFGPILSDVGANRTAGNTSFSIPNNDNDTTSEI